MFRVKVFTALCAIAATLSACSHETPGPAVEQPVGLIIDAPRLTVDHAGTGEKKLLEYHDIDSSQEVSYRATEGFSQDLLNKSAAADFQAAGVNKATTTLPLTASVDKATEDVEDQLPASRNAFVTTKDPEYSGDTDVSSASGFQFGWRGQDNGQMNSLRLAAPQAASDEARGIVEQAIMKLTALPIVFPKEEVGTGATWTVDSRVTGESTLLQTTRYTVESLDGDRVTLSVAVEQRPALGALSLDGQSESTQLQNKELNVLDSSTHSSGSVTVDLTKPLPVNGYVSFETKVTYGTADSDLRVVQSSLTELAFSE